MILVAYFFTTKSVNYFQPEMKDAILIPLVLYCAPVTATDDDEDSDADTDMVSAENANPVSGGVDANVDMTGFAIINGKLWIDGVSITKPQAVYVSKKNGKTYHISWAKNGSPNVTEE